MEDQRDGSGEKEVMENKKGKERKREGLDTRGDGENRLVPAYGCPNRKPKPLKKEAVGVVYELPVELSRLAATAAI